MAVLPDNIHILKGHHSNPDAAGGCCVMDWVSIVCNLSVVTDDPPCADPVLRSYAIRINDAIQDDTLRTELLAPVILLLANTKSTPIVEQRRAYFLTDRAVHVFAPIALRARNRPNQAAKLEALPQIKNKQTAAAAIDAIAAAYAAAGVYTADAAGAAVGAAAGAAADAAAAAAGAAAGAADAAAAIWRLAVDTLIEAVRIS